MLSLVQTMITQIQQESDRQIIFVESHPFEQLNITFFRTKSYGAMQPPSFGMQHLSLSRIPFPCGTRQPALSPDQDVLVKPSSFFFAGQLSVQSN
jgi:hypothetical protein